jgi:hypothetical protein
MPGYLSLGAVWSSSGNQMTRQWSDEQRLLPRLRDWITERKMARLTRLARRASKSWWSRTCRWQVGLVAGWSLWLLIFGALILAHAMTWWILTKVPRRDVSIIAVPPLFLTFIPAITTVISVSQWGTVKRLSREMLLPVERKSCIR